ncbi:MAG TPA: DNA-formamidopyrimidine glycosylase [Rhodospirillaceae bacterium]|nr:DNA-formamidopyrimidine glycosylase [Rhodospirillaceae bacterium]HAA92163.1 DNA-formamidopyrimidine glycosylase [Rhodospirillaceae bacterium]HAT34452.1 DNA-formamidopyrimidine glycosylase [Rhodospirillaceae bacterium]
MPELPEVETVCAGLRPALEGQRLENVIQRRPDLRFPFPDNFTTDLTGRRVQSVRRRAKFILIHLDGGLVLMIHLGMSGRMILFPANPPPPGRHDHVEFLAENGTTIRFSDVRRFGFMDLIPIENLDSHPMLRELGPEPLSEEFNVEMLNDKLHGRRTPIKAALLDQKVVAGLGNIYVCEALFKSGISPRRLARSIPGKRCERLVPAIKDVLRDAIAAGGSSLRDFVGTDGELGYFQTQWSVYGREGEECRTPLPEPGSNRTCPGPIKRIVQSGRSTFYCAKCQR